MVDAEGRRSFFRTPFFDIAMDEMIGRPFCVQPVQTTITMIPRMQNILSPETRPSKKGQSAKVCVRRQNVKRLAFL